MESTDFDRLISEGRLEEALEAASRAVREKSAEAKPRILLFQLLCILGRWERAISQLKVLPDLDADTLLMSKVCGTAIQCEVFRKKVFSGQKQPLLFGKPSEWVAQFVQANQQLATGQVALGRALLDQAYEAAPAVSGKINGEPFQWIGDADRRLGPLFEAVIEGRYFWVPLQQVRRIDIEKPTDLRDLVWIPARFTWVNQGDTVALIPVRYIGTEDAGDPLLMLSRKTDWVRHNELELGRGQRLLATDAGDYPLLEIRTIEFDVPENTGGSTTEVNHG